MAEQEIRQADHVVHCTVLLVLVSQPGLQLHFRRPDLALRLSARGKAAALRHGTAPVGADDIHPALFPGDLIRAGASQDLRDGRVGMHVGQHVLPLQQGIKQPCPVIPLQQLPVLFLSRKAKHVRPDLQHAARFHIQNVVEFLPGILPAPVQEPVTHSVRDPQRLFAAEDPVCVRQPHQQLVHGILRCPDALSLSDPDQILFRDRAGPAVTVLPLADLQLVDDCHRLRPDFLIAGLLPAGRCRGEPVAQKMPAQLAAGILPATHGIQIHAPAGDQPCLQQKIPQQIAVLQLHHIFPVAVFPAQKRVLPQNDLPSLQSFHIRHPFPFFFRFFSP